MRLFNLKRRGTCPVCPVLWEEGHREVSPYPDVCRAWHLTSRVKVLIPGIRRAEG